jgi:acetyl-CoA synthetase
VLWNPSREFIESTNVWRFMRRLGFEDRESFLAFSRDNPDRFYPELIRELHIDFFQPYTQVADISRGPEWTQWFLDGRLNIAHNCLDRWVGVDRPACIWESESGATRTVSFAELYADSNRVANGLRALGLESGDRVALCMPMVPEILVILYGCFKLGLTVVPIFAGFGAGAIETRLRDSGAKVLFTAPHLERRGKRLPLAEKMPDFEGQTIVVDGPLLPEQPAEASTLSLPSEHRAFILYTSGTTGKPKSAVHTRT